MQNILVFTLINVKIKFKLKPKFKKNRLWQVAQFYSTFLVVDLRGLKLSTFSRSLSRDRASNNEINLINKKSI